MALCFCAYLIKSDQKQRIKDIKNPYILKIEFPDEMKLKL